MAAPKGEQNGNYKKNVIYNNGLYSVTEMVVGTDLTPGALRSRLNRTASRKIINGVVCFVCTAKYLRPNGKVGKPSLKPLMDMPFYVSRYSLNVDGDYEQLKLNKRSQDWLSKSIRISQ